MSRDDLVDLGAGGEPVVREAVMTTEHGSVAIHAFQWGDEDPYVALVHPEFTGPAKLRVQAQCLTSTAFGAQMCDCRRQIEAGVRLAAWDPAGLMIYLPQEGRGYGLLSKVEVMASMNAGLLLRDAQLDLGRADSRLSYRRVPEILRHLKIDDPVMLMTDNVAKIRGLKEAGVQIRGVEGLDY